MTKSIITSTKAIFLSIAMFTLTQCAVAKKGTEKLTIKTNIYCNHCMECETCGIMLTKELKYIKGVKFGFLDAKAMTFTVEYNAAKTTPVEIRLAISKLGYDADDVKADAVAYEKLDGCCKKPE